MYKSFVFNHLLHYPTAADLNFLWCFGSLSGIFLVIQILSGIFLTFFYIADIQSAFMYLQHLYVDISFGNFLRNIHANGASFFFFIVYLHIFRNLFYRSYLFPRFWLWLSGFLILLLLIVIAFLGYSLPFGQMSFWAATVITSLFSVIPLIGLKVEYLLWGDFGVAGATLLRFFSLHYALPFILIALSLVHLNFLHIHGSSSPLFSRIFCDGKSFSSLFFFKDFIFWVLIILLYLFFVSFYPNALAHPDNFIPANGLITPAHIVPEWYFLTFYGLLRAIPIKEIGICLLILVLILFALISFFEDLLSQVFISFFKIIPKLWFIFVYLFVFFGLIFSFFILGWCGAQIISYPFSMLSMWFLCFLFFFFLCWVCF